MLRPGVVTFPIGFLTGGLLWYLGMPIRTTWGVVEMKMTLRRPGGHIVGTYSGSRRFVWRHTVYNTRWALFGCPAKLNEMFNEVVGEMRAAMIGDRRILEDS